MKNLLFSFLLIALVVTCRADCGCDDCPDGEIYDKCGSAPQPNCDVRYPVSNKKCTPGCYCPKGQIREKEGGPCIPVKDCPPSPCKGDIYAVWVKKPNLCPPTCQHPKPPKKCYGDCDDWGCECKKGYILDEVSKKCVKPCDCPHDCPKGEIYDKCGSAPQPNCDDRYPDSDKKCTPGCYCPKGEIRKNKGGPCIPVKDCPPSPCKGDDNAVWVKNPNLCPPTCQHPKPPKKCYGDCDKWGCECKKGYILDEVSKKCVKPCDCPKCGCDDGDDD